MVAPAIVRLMPLYRLGPPIPYWGPRCHVGPHIVEAGHKTLILKGKGPGEPGPFVQPDSLLRRRLGLAALPDVDVVDRILDVALGVVGQRTDGGVVGALAQRRGDLGGLDRIGLLG